MSALYKGKTRIRATAKESDHKVGTSWKEEGLYIAPECYLLPKGLEIKDQWQTCLEIQIQYLLMKVAPEWENIISPTAVSTTVILPMMIHLLPCCLLRFAYAVSPTNYETTNEPQNSFLVHRMSL